MNGCLKMTENEKKNTEFLVDNLITKNLKKYIDKKELNKPSLVYRFGDIVVNYLQDYEVAGMKHIQEVRVENIIIYLPEYVVAEKDIEKIKKNIKTIF